MAEERVQRRLAAILTADAAGYSRLMGEDEEGTLAALTAHRAEAIDPAIAAHNGRLVKTTGDGLLAEFASIVDAVRCAMAIQDSIAERNADVADARRIAFRIGVNIGDVIVQDDDVFGEGVNIAARLEGLAEPGAVWLSEDAYRQVRGKVDCDFQDMGAKRVKNIAQPVRAYRVPPAAGKAAPPETPEMPSIAVLPFQNMSGDADQEYFADGMVEEIITALSRFKWLLVMARNSSFIYKGRAVDVREAARELGVRYVLEGSVRRAGQRVRITGQLIDASTGAHMWADRFDGDIEDVFDLQDEVTACVVGAIEPSLRRAEIERSLRKRPESLDAYDLFLRALAPVNKMHPEANPEALDLLEQAIALDPTYAPALAYAAWCYEQRLLHDWPTATPSDAETATRLARAALAIDSGDAAAIAMAGFVLAIVGHDFDGGRVAAHRALDLNPNSTGVCWMAGWVIQFDGRPDEALAVFERALRLSPSDPQANFLLTGIGMAHLVSQRPQEAYQSASRAAALYPDVDVTYYVLVPACAQLGRIDEMDRAVAKLLSVAPSITISSFERRMPFRERNHLKILLAGLRRAGLPA